MQPRAPRIRKTYAVSAVLFALIIMLFAYSFVSAMPEHRDSERLLDMYTLSEALATHAANGGAFPRAPEPLHLTGDDAINQALLESNSLSAAVSDPSHPRYAYIYATDARGTEYSISFCLETEPHEGAFRRGCGNIITP